MSEIKTPSAVPGESLVGDTPTVPITIPSQATHELAPVANRHTIKYTLDQVYTINTNKGEEGKWGSSTP